MPPDAADHPAWCDPDLWCRIDAQPVPGLHPAHRSAPATHTVGLASVTCWLFQPAGQDAPSVLLAVSNGPAAATVELDLAAAAGVGEAVAGLVKLAERRTVAPPANASR